MRFGLIASPSDKAQAAYELLRKHPNATESVSESDVFLVLGGDGSMLKAIHTFMTAGRPFYGMNLGSVGFLMNDYDPDNIIEKLESAVATEVQPLQATVKLPGDITFPFLAINDVAITRAESQAAKLRISVNGQVKMEELIGDGLIVSTPVGSTAYNRSAGGPILPLESPMFAVTPICAFRPRHWKGAIVPDNFVIDVDVLEATHRPVMITADSSKITHVTSVRIETAADKKFTILSDQGRSWSDKLLNEQFYG
jgi:NAD+ kinase